MPLEFVNKCWHICGVPDAPAKSRKSDRTRAAILAAARDLFARDGYDGATIRDIAARADIDPAMVIRYFGSKDDLFIRAADIDLRLPDLSATAPADAGRSLVEHFLDIWEGPAANPGLVVLLRSAAANDYAADRVREVFAAQSRPALARLGNPADGDRRAGLVVSQLLGLALCRYIFRLPPVVQLSRAEVLDHIGPVIQRYLDGAA